MVSEHCKSLNEYLEKFDLPNLALQSKFGLEHCTYDLLKRLYDDSLKYAEIRMAPQLSTNQGLSQEEVVLTLIDTLQKAEKEIGIKSNLILCMMRGDQNLEKNLKTIELANKYKNQKVIAVDLAGAEALFPNEMFAKEFELINKYGLNLTIHAGEASGSESVKTALGFGAKRIGHGIHSIDDKNIMDLLKKREICLEICPKSNLDTKTINRYEELPIREFMEYGIKVAINTDDMTVSNTTLKGEYLTLSKLGFNKKELQQFALNTIEYSFADKDTKEYLKKFIL